VWLARHVALDQQRALKVLRLDRLGPEEQDLLRHDAHMMAQLPPHANRVHVIDIEEWDGQLVLVMAYVHGGTLAQRVQRKPLPWQDAVRYLHDAAEGLTDLHGRGIQHRDIKPGNFLWDAQQDRAVLSDYGLADRVGHQARGRTPGYAAPEVVAGAPDFASDVFALAASLYYLLTRRLPFPGPSEAEMVQQMHAGLPRPDPCLAGVPRAVEGLVRAGLQPEGRRRPALNEFREELRRMPMRVLAEQLCEQVRGSKCPVRLRVAVATAPGPRQPFTRVLQLENRDEDPGRAVEATTGQLIRYEVTADAEGYLTVLNFGAEGKVEMFLPQKEQKSPRLVPGQVAKLTTALAPPVGKEHTAVIWTRQPGRLSAGEWNERIKAVERGQVFVLADVDCAEDWTAVAVPVVQRAVGR
jgi:serine/threonine protein kinase